MRRDRVRTLLTALRQQPFNTQQNDCAITFLEFCRGFGCNTELTDNAGTGQKVNGITCLCWNMPCGGYELMTVSEGHLAGRIGFGCRSQPSELAAVLALSEVPVDYPARFGRLILSVADIIEYEKLTCRPGADMSLKLVALSHYVREPSWKDNLGNEWTLRRMVGEELNRPVGAGTYAATNRLLGLVCALERFSPTVPTREKTRRSTGTWPAENYIAEATTYAYAAQNTNGSWGRTAAATTPTPSPTPRTCWNGSWPRRRRAASKIPHRGRHRLPDDFLQLAALPGLHFHDEPAEISAAMHAAYVLNFYDQAVFAPADPPAQTAPPKTEKSEQKAAELPTDGGKRLSGVPLPPGEGEGDRLSHVDPPILSPPIALPAPRPARNISCRRFS